MMRLSRTIQYTTFIREPQTKGRIHEHPRREPKVCPSSKGLNPRETSSYSHSGDPLPAREGSAGAAAAESPLNSREIYRCL